MIRRAFSYLVAFLLVALVVAIRYYPEIKRYFPRSSLRTALPVPVATPGSIPVEGPYFSDRDRVAERIIAAINHTQKSLDLAIYDLTHPDITAALVDAHRRGVTLRIVADERQSHEPHSEIPFLRSQGFPLRLSRGYRGNRSIMHNKFAVFDGRLAETGSFNWTTSADGYNYENAIFFADPKVVARFEEEFQRIWAQAQ